MEVLNLLEEVTEEGGVATSVSQEPRSGSANTVGEILIMAWILDKQPLQKPTCTSSLSGKCSLLKDICDLFE